ncbi:MAG: 50S ribosomal protein L29 [Gemmatimonadaceae bacterium]|nr:50S ribosomal protein L29 [Gemmatimonadaceae bacterium]
MLASEIREMAPADIQARIAELEEERFRLRFRSATEQLEEPLRLRAIRRDIARLKTVLRQQELGQVAQTTTPAAAPKKRAAKKTASAGK